jgi:hypothetical protein
MIHPGSCHCGAVRFEAEAPLRPVIACHCTQCRRTSGHFWAATSVHRDRFRLRRDDSLAWFRSSPRAQRGFCRTCGASLFWAADGEDRLSLAAGALDGPTGLAVAEHWHAEDAGDYYAPEGPPPPPGPAPGRLAGSCLCGACRFTLPGPAGPVTACHCTQCRKLSGHYSASFDADEGTLDWLCREALALYATPAGARRGFCAACGASLFFRAKDGAFSVEAGVIVGATGGGLASHIFVAGKGDYYDLTDGLPQHPGPG